jgi:hypothetical protein
MIKKIGVLLVTILGGLLLVYSATRSLDFIELTLPADRKILAYFGLAALDGGLVAWLLSYLNGSRGAWQRAISILMVIVDTLGAIAMFTFDTLYNTGKNGMTEVMTPDAMTNAVLALSGIIALNIIATIAHHITDPDKMREQAEEEAFSKTEEATLKQISKNADQLAAQLAPIMAADWQAQTQARYMSYVGTGQRPTIDAVARDVAPALPIIEEPSQPVNLGALWGGMVNAVGNKGSKANTPAVVTETKATWEDGTPKGMRHKTFAEQRAIHPMSEEMPGYAIKAMDGEASVRDRVRSGACECPPAYFDPDKFPTEEMRAFVMEKGGAHCWNPFLGIQRLDASAAATCEKCAFFKNTPKGDGVFTGGVAGSE